MRHRTSPAVTVTDSAGVFQLMLPPVGRYPLRVEQLGYETALLVLPSTAPIELSTVSLAAAPLVLQGIEVTVDRFARRRRFATQPVRTVDAAHLSGTFGRGHDVVLRLITGARTCPNDISEICKQRRRAKPVTVCIDDRRSYDTRRDLDTLDSSDLYMVEIYDTFEPFTVRVYTRRFIAGLASGERRLRPWQWGCVG